MSLPRREDIEEEKVEEPEELTETGRLNRDILSFIKEEDNNILDVLSGYYIREIINNPEINDELGRFTRRAINIREFLTFREDTKKRLERNENIIDIDVENNLSDLLRKESSDFIKKKLSRNPSIRQILFININTDKGRFIREKINSVSGNPILRNQLQENISKGLRDFRQPRLDRIRREKGRELTKLEIELTMKELEEEISQDLLDNNSIPKIRNHFIKLQKRITELQGLETTELRLNRNLLRGNRNRRRVDLLRILQERPTPTTA